MRKKKWRDKEQETNIQSRSKLKRNTQGEKFMRERRGSRNRRIMRDKAKDWLREREREREREIKTERDRERGGEVPYLTEVCISMARWSWETDRERERRRGGGGGRERERERGPILQRSVQAWLAGPERQTERQTDRQTDREVPSYTGLYKHGSLVLRDRKTDKERERDRDREREREREREKSHLKHGSLVLRDRKTDRHRKRETETKREREREKEREREVPSYRGLYKHGSLVPHLPHDCQGVHRLVGFNQVHGCLHGDQNTRPSYTSTGNTQPTLQLQWWQKLWDNSTSSSTVFPSPTGICSFLTGAVCFFVFRFVTVVVFAANRIFCNPSKRS